MTPEYLPKGILPMSMYRRLTALCLCLLLLTGAFSALAQEETVLTAEQAAVIAWRAFQALAP